MWYDSYRCHDTRRTKKNKIFQTSVHLYLTYFCHLQHGGSWRRRSLIEDAKFETVTNLEFEKRERTLSSRNSISEEEEEVFAHNGELISPVETEPPHLILLIITIKEGISSLSRILRIFEVRKFVFSIFMLLYGLLEWKRICAFF